MKSSYFNICVRCDDKVLLYNLLSKKVFCSHNISLMSLLNASTEIKLPMDKTVLDKLFKYGFIVGDEKDEIKRVEMEFCEMIMDPVMAFTIMTTYKCNFRCKYCYESFENISMDKAIERSIVLHVRKYMNEHTGLCISWFGGEPLLEMPLIDRLSKKFINICKALRKPYSGSITTNGYYLTLERFQKLLEDRVMTYQVTIDGVQKVHDKYRVLESGDGTFERIIQNLRNIRDNVTSRTFSIIIRTNCTQETLEYLEEYIHFMSEEFSGDSRFSLLFKHVGNYGGKQIDEIKDKLSFSNESMYQILLGCRYPINYDCYLSELNSRRCYAGVKNDYTIAPDGTVMKCTVHLNDERNRIGRLTLDGNMEIDRDKENMWLLGGSTVEGSTSLSRLYEYSSCPANYLNKDRYQNQDRDNYEMKNEMKNWLRLLNKSCGCIGRTIEEL